MEDENEDEWEDEIEEGGEGERARGGWTAELARLGFSVASYLLWRCLILFFFSCLRAELFLQHSSFFAFGHSLSFSCLMAHHTFNVVFRPRDLCLLYSAIRSSAFISSSCTHWSYSLG